MTDIRGKSICFTGKLYNFTRNQARAMALNAGMNIHETVTSYLDYLVMADPNSTSTKACKARKYGVKLISEDDFLKMMDLDKKTVEADTEYRKTHKEKKVLDWKTCFDVITKKLGVTSQKKSEPVYSRGKDEKTIDISMWIGHDVYLGSSNDILQLGKYDGSELEWSDDDRYDATEDDAYRKAVWLIGTKCFRRGWWTDDGGAKSETIKRLKESYPEFGMPGSTEELKLKLEVLDWSIL